MLITLPILLYINCHCLQNYHNFYVHNVPCFVLSNTLWYRACWAASTRSAICLLMDSSVSSCADELLVGRFQILTPISSIYSLLISNSFTDSDPFEIAPNVPGPDFCVLMGVKEKRWSSSDGMKFRRNLIHARS